jgi:hypothetical protein
MQRSRLCLFKRPTNQLNHAQHILIHFVIPKPQHSVSALGKPRSASRIMLRGRRFKMLRTIEFNNKSPREANEVHDIRAKRSLAAKLVAVDLAGAQVEPETLLSACGLSAKTPGEVALVAVAVHAVDSGRK